MLDFVGVNCPVCGRAFQESDDVVVCPDCGAPYHRACYRQVGECVFGDLHAKGEEWSPPAPPNPTATAASAAVKDVECPVCGTLNDHGAVSCARCGAPLREGPVFQRGEAGQGAAPFSAQPGPMGMPFAFGDPMGGVSPAEELEDGVTYGDASKLVRQNTAYYMPVFRFIKRTRRNKFNFAAFLFSGGWMLYRKQYKWGAVVTGIMLALHAAFWGVYALVSIPAMEALAQRAGIDLTETAVLTTEQYAMLTQASMADPGLSMRVSAFLPIPLLMLAVMIFVGVRGNKMYLDHCAATLREARAGGEDLQVTLTEQGGVSTPLALAVAICFFAIRAVFLFLFGAAL